MKNTDSGFDGFGEAYFSTVDPGFVKGWKRHSRMTLNFIVPAGEIQVCVMHPDSGGPENFVLGSDVPVYRRLTIPPGHWVAFGGRGRGFNLLLNLASIPHDPTESETRELSTWPWKWV